jgi:hypothetical protein
MSPVCYTMSQFAIQCPQFAIQCPQFAIQCPQFATQCPNLLHNVPNFKKGISFLSYPRLNTFSSSYKRQKDENWNGKLAKSYGQETAELLGKDNCPKATFSITKLMWIGNELNPGFCSEKPATNTMSHGTVNLRMIFI